jgi:hypothetical protein
MQTASAAGGRKCAHMACNCMVSTTEQFCSDHCETHSMAHKQDSADVGGCGCGHDECGEPTRAANG